MFSVAMPSFAWSTRKALRSRTLKNPVISRVLPSVSANQGDRLSWPAALFMFLKVVTAIGNFCAEGESMLM